MKDETLPARQARGDMVEIVDSIRSITQALRTSGREAEQKHGISSAQLNVLQELQDTPALSINELAERTYTHQSSVSMVVARLVEGKYVTRTAARGDARKVSISLTASGRALLRRSPDAGQARLTQALKSMSRAELRSLSGSLNLLSDRLDAQSESKPAAKPATRPRLSLRA
jgi:DNA-binding MarR family transcriptional regulator